jgi:hypothetical protein
VTHADLGKNSYLHKFRNLILGIQKSLAVRSTIQLFGTTKLDVRKRIEKKQAKLKEKTGLSIIYEFVGDLPDGDVGLFVICNLISDVTVCLIELSQTEIGKEAIMEGVKKVTFKKTNSDFSLTRKNSEVIIQGTLNRSFTTTERRWKLKDLIEGVL